MYEPTSVLLLSLEFNSPPPRQQVRGRVMEGVLYRVGSIVTASQRRVSWS